MIATKSTWSQEERVGCLQQVRVVYLNEEAIRHDFRFLRGWSSASIEQWLCRRAGLLSLKQAAGGAVNPPVPLGEGPERWAHRPGGYGRAFLVPVDPEHSDEWFDLKGVGVAPGAIPRLDVHGDGLLHLGQALKELLLQQLIDRILAHSGAPVCTLPTYAVLDAGFSGRDHRVPDVWRPASILVRRGRLRPEADLPKIGALAQRRAAAVECLLRRYGLTSANPASHLRRVGDEVWLGPLKLPGMRTEMVQRAWAHLRSPDDGIDGINIQLTAAPRLPAVAELVDFGHYHVPERLHRPLASLVSDRPMGLGGVLFPDDAAFPTPDPTLALSAEDWGQVSLSDEDCALLEFPEGSGLLAAEWLGMRLAALWGQEQIGRTGIRSTLTGYLDRTTSHLEAGNA